jgi:hypothetical protein
VSSQLPFVVVAHECNQSEESLLTTPYMQTRSIWSATHLDSALHVRDIDTTKTRKGPRKSRKELFEAKLAEDGVHETASTPLAADFPVWKDVELVMSHHTEERMLVGGRPKTLEEALKKWYLAQG